MLRTRDSATVPRVRPFEQEPGRLAYLRCARWGETARQPPRSTHASGALAFDLRGSWLDDVRYAGLPLLRRIYVGVRDRNWSTVPGTVLRRDSVDEAGRSVATVEVVHRAHDVDFAWTGTFALSGQELVVEMEGRVRRDFRRTRIGLCLLHPLHLAGTPVEVVGKDGLTTSRFPTGISPWQPLRDISELRYGDGGVRVSIALEGETFETEDQRNWTDASYKTYGTPLALPFPVLVRDGDRVWQRMRLRVSGDDGTARAGGGAVRVGGGAGDHGAWVPVLGPGRAVPRVELGNDVGPLPPIGLQHVGPARTDQQSSVVSATGPAFLHGRVELDNDRWRQRVDDVMTSAAKLGVPVTLTVRCSSTEQVEQLADLPGPAIDTVLLFDARTHKTLRPLAEAGRRALAGTGIRLGGGSSAHFAELNRTDDLPIDLLDVIAFPASAQMHDTDRACVRETLRVHAAVVRQACERAEGRPVLVGPVGFWPPFNAVATDAGELGLAGGEPVGAGRESAGARGEPVGAGAFEPRQLSVFGAAWTVGALAGLGYGGAAALSMYETLSWRGIAAPASLGRSGVGAVGRGGGWVGSGPGALSAGTPFPLWQVLVALRPFHGGRLRALRLPPGLIGLAVRKGADQLLLLANLADTATPVRLGEVGALAHEDWDLLAADDVAGLGWSVRRQRRVGSARTFTLPAPGVAFFRSTERTSDG